MDLFRQCSHSRLEYGLWFLLIHADWDSHLVQGTKKDATQKKMKVTVLDYFSSYRFNIEKYQFLFSLQFLKLSWIQRLNETFVSVPICIHIFFASSASDNSALMVLQFLFWHSQ